MFKSDILVIEYYMYMIVVYNIPCYHRACINTSLYKMHVPLRVTGS